MAWLAKSNFVATDKLLYSDMNNLAMDIRNWGGNVNGGNYTLSNVIIPGAQTPWNQNIDGNAKLIGNIGGIGIGVNPPRGHIHVKGNLASVWFEDAQAPQTAGRYHRLTSVGAAGAWIWQINTAALGAEFTTTINGIVFNPNGNVCISTLGTGAPSPRLETFGVGGAPAVSGTSQAAGSLRASRAGGSNVLDVGCYTLPPFGLWLQGCDYANLASTYPIILQPNGGKVGIGTSDPIDHLHVRATGVPVVVRMSVATSRASMWYFDGTQFLLLFTDAGLPDAGFNGARPFCVSATTGNVGIGAPSTSFKLEVTGNMNLSAGFNYYRNGNPIALGAGVTSRSVVTEARALGTVYQNTTEQARIVSVTITFANAEDKADAYTDETETPMTLVGSTVGPVTLMFWVLPAHYYRIASTDPAAAISSWVEWE